MDLLGSGLLDFVKGERVVLKEQRDAERAARAEEHEKEREAREHEAERDRLHAKEMLEMRMRIERDKAEFEKESVQLNFRD